MFIHSNIYLGKPSTGPSGTSAQRSLSHFERMTEIDIAGRKSISFCDGIYPCLFILKILPQIIEIRKL
jgi:hypothetical protein